MKISKKKSKKYLKANKNENLKSMGCSKSSTRGMFIPIQAYERKKKILK